MNRPRQNGAPLFSTPRKFVFNLLIAAALPVLAGCVTDMPNASSMKVSGLSSTPPGYVEFCRRHPADCRDTQMRPATVAMTAEKFKELERVHQKVNRKVRYTSDIEQFGVADRWEYPQGEGDCEDFALEKKRRLIALGWPDSALLLTLAKSDAGVTHLILVAVTDAGDYALDNRRKWVVPWSSLKYEWYKRQSQTSRTAWLSLRKTPARQLAFNETQAPAANNSPQ